MFSSKPKTLKDIQRAYAGSLDKSIEDEYYQILEEAKNEAICGKGYLLYKPHTYDVKSLILKLKSEGFKVDKDSSGTLLISGWI